LDPGHEAESIDAFPDERQDQKCRRVVKWY
jgi:hypothetical protein